MDNTYHYTLLRINLNNSFHKNADGTKIFGNRINIFSEAEYYAKGDGATHYRTYPLPYRSIKNTSDFFEMFQLLIDYLNISLVEPVTFTIPQTLDLFNGKDDEPC